MNAKEYKRQRDAAEAALVSLVAAYYAPAGKRNEAISEAWLEARERVNGIEKRNAVAAARAKRPEYALIGHPVP